MNAEEIKAAVEQLHWYHEIDVCDGLRTVPVARFPEVWELIETGMKDMKLEGKRVLDIGTRDGKYAFAAEKMGATVVAIDNNQSPGALLLKDYFDSKVQFREQSLYDLDADRYDVILFFGVLYHLRYPMNAIRILSQLLPIGGKLYIESGMMDAHNELPMMYCPVRESPYEVTSCTFFNFGGLLETLWSFGLTVTSHQTHPNEAGKFVRRFWVEAEKTHAIPDDLKAYWDAIHHSHS